MANTAKIGSSQIEMINLNNVLTSPPSLIKKQQQKKTVLAKQNGQNWQVDFEHEGPGTEHGSFSSGTDVGGWPRMQPWRSSKSFREPDECWRIDVFMTQRLDGLGHHRPSWMLFVVAAAAAAVVVVVVVILIALAESNPLARLPF